MNTTSDTTSPVTPIAETGVRKRKRVLIQWIRVLALPVIAVGTMFGAFFLIGYAQRAGWIEKQVAGEGELSATGVDGVRYICPMMCVPPTDDPGRCPVCEMELVPAETGPVLIDPATRRVLNIQTIRAVMASTDKGNPVREIQSVGELAYDEEKMKTISAYIDGRIEKLHAGFTGVKVSAGEPLAVIYSPPLFVAQKELLVSRRNVDRGRAVAVTDTDSFYETSRRRLSELGMTTSQIDELEQSGQANSRLELVAPMGGTVIEKLAVEGQYVDQGEAIYQLANLDQVWLMLKLFPEDAAVIQVGQTVTAAVDSLPGQTFVGTVAFVSPNIDPETRTVSVRVVLPNPEGDLRIGDFARASVPVIRSANPVSSADSEAVVVPRDAVLLVGADSVVYVETEPGRYEMRNVKVGSVSKRGVIVLEGLKAGESVARRGNFLIDSQMQLAGNPSLIDPGKAAPKKPAENLTPEMEEAIAELATEDQDLARKQRVCVVAEMALGSMGVPVRVELEGQVVFLCCEGCRGALMKNPQKFLEKLKQ
jgi:membrane fusion protein, copper/silver efflux system